MRIDIINSIADDYFVESEANCRTAGLTAFLTSPQRMLWLGYLIDYTYLLTGCPLDAFGEKPPPGALSVFGLANTSVAGANRRLLGQDDIDLLISMYVRIFGDALAMTAEQRTVLREFLESSASASLDPAASATLSICAGDAALP